MTQLIATTDLVYAGKEIKAGQAFKTESDSDAHVLITIGRARSDEIETRELKAEEEPGKKAKRYDTRQLKAED